MEKTIKKVLTKIEENGYEAYIIGGYVRDLLLGVDSYDIDICSNATPKELMSLFPNASSKNLGGIDFKINEYHFEITTYREELKYKNRKPIEFNYVTSLLTDLKRRDFTINTICMNNQGEIIDLLNGSRDLKAKKICLIGDNKKIKEDPLRILRGIRFATTLDFQLEQTFYKMILDNYLEIKKLSNTRIKEELDKILLSQNVKKGLRLLNDTKILNLWNMKYNQNIVPIRNIEGMYAQLEFNYRFNFTKEEKNNITKLREIIKLKDINEVTMYNYGLYLCLIAGDILNIDKSLIAKIHQDLPIHERKEIVITPKEIVNLGFKKDQINKIMKHLETKILLHELNNSKDQIINYLKTIERNL